MRRKNQILALGLAAVLTAASAVPAFAGYAPTGPGAEPEPEKYDAATLSKLQDNVLEYDELALRVREYNPNISEAWRKYGESKEDYQNMLTELETTLEGMDLGPLLGLWLQSSVIGLTMQIMGIIIFVLVYGRMIEIYLMTSLAPLPVATLSNRELGGTGQNYLKSLFAVGFQGMLILVCVAIYAVLVQGIATGGDPIGAIWGTVGYTVLLCFMLFKTGGIAQRIFGAH